MLVDDDGKTVASTAVLSIVVLATTTDGDGVDLSTKFASFGD